MYVDGALALMAFTKILWTQAKHANVQASFYDSVDCELDAQRPHKFQGWTVDELGAL